MWVWKKRLNSGLWWELIINQTIRLYQDQKVALIHKLALETKIFKTERAKPFKRVTNALIFARSRADYYGLFQGRFIAFEAKSTIKNSWAVNQIKPHQLKYLLEVEQLGGISFCLVAFLTQTRFFVVPMTFLRQNRQSVYSLVQIEKVACETSLRYPGYLDLLSCVKKLTWHSSD
ncbi:Holliday junction resolvase RecU [Mycoplasma sp. ATU-Cv-703]|uniref:Holliday junction resolvase RecU n=1 Tax=Mycoplasma sp. ATU-Cv-703 TaxID=2498595 RepID=UPI001374E1DD